MNKYVRLENRVLPVTESEVDNDKLLLAWHFSMSKDYYAKMLEEGRMKEGDTIEELGDQLVIEIDDGGFYGGRIYAGICDIAKWIHQTEVVDLAGLFPIKGQYIATCTDGSLTYVAKLNENKEWKLIWTPCL